MEWINGVLSALGMGSPIPDIRQPGSMKPDTTVHFWFVRHGETENNIFEDATMARTDLTHEEKHATFKKGRKSDPALSELGKTQVSRLLEHPQLQKVLEPKRPVKLLCSPLHRTIETATPLLKAIEGSTLKVLPMLHEGGGLYHTTKDGVDVGERGRTPSEFKESFADIADRLDLSECPEEGWYGVKKGKEDEESGEGCEFDTRVKKLAHWIRHQVPDIETGASDYIIVGHGALFDKLVGELLGVRTRDTAVIHVNTGVTHLEFSGQYLRIHCINALPAAPVSKSLAATCAV